MSQITSLERLFKYRLLRGEKLHLHGVSRRRYKKKRYIRQWSEEFGPIHLDLNLMPERSMSSWAKARLDRIAHKTHTSVQSILEVAAMCVLDYQQNHEDNEDLSRFK